MSPTATAPPPVLASDMIAVSTKAKVGVLGYITWFSVPDKPVNLKRLRKAWISRALDHRVLPKDPRPLYLFKRAMRAQEGKVRNDDGTVTETDVKLVLEDRDYCIYQISRVVRDADKRQVDYPKAMRVVFDKGTVNDPLSFQPHKETPLTDCLPMQEAIEEYYEKNGTLVDGRKVRGMVRDFIKDNPVEGDDGHDGLRGENLRGKAGGVYFVAAEHRDTLDALAEALAEVGAELSTVPMADGTGERELLRRHHLNNTIAEMDEEMAAVAAILRSDRKQDVRADHAAFHFGKLASFRDRAKQYAEMLGDEQEDIETRLSLLERQLNKLPEAVRP